MAELAAAAARHAGIGAAVRAGYERRHAMARGRLARAREHEGLPGDLDPGLLIEQIAGPVYYRIVITGEPVTPGYADRLVAQVLAGALPPKA